MSEVKREVERLEEGKTYTAGPDDYLITEEHTLADILRFLVDQAGGDKEDVSILLKVI